MKVGDRVKIIGFEGFEPWVAHHRNHEGEMDRVSGTSPYLPDVVIVMLEGDAGEQWFKISGLQLLSDQPVDSRRCSCGGPERLVPLFTSVARVCGTCGKDKS